MCGDGANIVVAGADAAALLPAVKAVYDELEKDAGDGVDVKRIAEMKAGIPAEHRSTGVRRAHRPHRLRRPPEASPKAPRSATLVRGAPGILGGPPELELKHRFPCPVVMGFTLKDNTFVENYGERWTFSFFGDHIQLGNFTLRWSWDGKKLTFSEIEGGEEGDEQAWTTQPFVKLADPATPVVGFPDGTYRRRSPRTR